MSSVFVVTKHTTPGQLNKYNIYNKFTSINSSFVITSDLINNGNPSKISNIKHNIVTYKYCKACDTWLPNIKFFSFSNTWDKLSRQCKTCKKSSSANANKLWKEKNKKHIAEYNAKYNKLPSTISSKAKKNEENKHNVIADAQIRERERKEMVYGKFVQLAKLNDGVILSPIEEYENSYTRIRCKCKYGHEFTQQWANCNTGKWCRECSYADRGKTISKNNFAKHESGTKIFKTRRSREEIYLGLVDIAKNKGAEVLEQYDSNKGATSKYKCKCSNGHEFEISPNNADGGKWCKICGFKNKISTRKANAIAKAQKESKPLPQPKKQVRTPEQRTADDLARRTKTFDEAKASVERRGFTMLSTIVDYKNARESKLKIDCGKGHHFESNWNNLKKGNGCPKCNKYTVNRAAKKTSK